MSRTKLGLPLVVLTCCVIIYGTCGVILIGKFTEGSVYRQLESKHMESVVEGFLVGGSLVYLCCVGVLAKRLGKSVVVWVGVTFLTGPFGVVASYVLMVYSAIRKGRVNANVPEPPRFLSAGLPSGEIPNAGRLLLSSLASAVPFIVLSVVLPRIDAFSALGIGTLLILTMLCFQLVTIVSFSRIISRFGWRALKDQVVLVSGVILFLGLTFDLGAFILAPIVEAKKRGL